MYRRVLFTLCTLGLIGGCAQPQWSMEPPEKPGVPPEMAKLARFLGTWTGTAEMVSPSPEEMKAETPEGTEEMPESFAGGGKFEWTLGGMFLKGQGWHEMGEGQRMNYVEYWTWYPKAKKYRTSSYTDWGDSMQGWAWFGPDDNTLRFKGTGVNAQGAKSRGSGMLTFTSDTSYEWRWKESGPMGKMEFKGEAKRER
ncbi:MAG: hypothetical protein JSU86_16435 [Phycisphaerales bacterium]|nr:MAG: hypothetical protein JSU86_16435 [Phycisphaerales bacterium]